MHRTCILLFLVLTFTSCDPGTQEVYYLNNQTDSTLYITFINDYSDNDTMVISNPHTLAEIYEVGHIGAVGDPGEYFLHMDSFKIYKDEARQREIALDYKNRIHWLYRMKKDKSPYNRGGTNYHTLELVNEDM